MPHNITVFEEINKHLLNDDKPSLYFNGSFNTFQAQQSPLDLLIRLKGTEQSPKHHPEGNVWNHTMMVVDEAAKIKDESSDEKVFMWAALLHDLGKPDATKNRNGKITSYDHDKIGKVLTKKFLYEFTDEDEFIEKVSELVRWHMQILYVANDLPFADISSMKKNTDVYEIALLGLCDRLGRTGANKVEEEINIRKFLKKCNASNMNVPQIN